MINRLKVFGRAARFALSVALVIDCADFGPSSSGKLLWRFPDAAPASHSPAFDSSSGVLYYVAKGHRVVAVDIDGARKWDGRSFPNSGISSGTGGCATAAELVVCNDSGLVALRRSNGELAWRFTSAELGLFRVPFVVRGGSVYAASANGKVYALEAATGVQRWVQTAPTFSSFSPNVSGLVADESALYVAYTRFSPNQGGMMALDPQTGSRLWLVDYPASTTSNAGTAILWEDFVLAGAADGRVHAIDKARGWVLWSLPAGQNAGDMSNLPSALCVSGSTLYAASKTKGLIAYDLKSQKEAWRIDLASFVTGVQVSCGGGQTYVTYSVAEYPSTYYDGVAAVSLTGRVAWRYDVSGTLLSGPPAVASDRILVASSTGVWAFSR